MTLAATSSEIGAIRSEFRQFPSRNGASVAAYIDHPPGSNGERSFVVMVPKYAETKKNNLQLAYYLAANGFTVLRFDFTCHFGESEGNMLDFTLPESVENITAACDFLEQTFAATQVTLIASSLSSLPAFRAAAEDKRISHVVGIVPVMDFAYTIDKIYQEDLIGGYLKGQRLGVLDIMGHDVNMDHFCDVTVGANMHNLDGTLESVRRIQCPITLLPAANDVWIAIEDVKKVAAANPRVTVRPIEDAMHEVRENKAAADAMLREVICACWRHRFGSELDPASIAEPDKKRLFAQNRIERDRLRKARPWSAEEDEFWGEYLGKYGVMEKIDGYQQYLDAVGAELGEIKDGEILLDAGCGNGLFGIWVLRELIEKRRGTYEVPPLYFGMDLTDEGLSEAVEKHADARSGLERNIRRGEGPGIVYSRVDMDKFGCRKAKGKVPVFSENCFDKMVCSLLLSYLKDPERLLTYLYRLLRPGGCIAITSMKPFADLSAIYRNFVEQQAAKSDIVAARELLRAAGAIQIKLDQGYYTFFSEEELTGMLERSGFRGLRAFSSLGNQAIVVAATK